MSGRVFAIAFVSFVVLFGAALWYFQTRAYYEEVARESIEIAGRTVPVADYRGVDATSSGLKRRGCFTLDPAAVAMLEPAPAAEPLNAPSWFDCFDAAAIARDLNAGAATAYRVGREEFDGIDRYVAVYPDGRAFEWRQLNERFAD